ncbi:MAG TPA: class I SAM-dependent methyltransferase [Gemmataceae bacterium]|nr:class I SAM-dependent methyltransferase [Gemmataceae bacterium]
MLLEAKERPFHGAVLQLGRQDINFGINELRDWARSSGVPLNDNGPIVIRHIPGQPHLQWIDDVTFFTQLGFENVQSCDTCDYEQATHIFDMNHPSPDQLNNRFDVILDGGTLEHIFNVPQAFGNLHKMLKVGGRAIHVFPVSNHVDHGFYSFSPTLFWDYYQANGYQVEHCYLTGQTSNPFEEFALFNYQPGCVDHLSFGGFTARIFMKYDTIDGFIVARKLPESTATSVPVQRRMAALWRHDKLAVDTLKQFRLLGYL